MPTIHVDVHGLPGGNGSGGHPFDNLPAAVALANNRPHDSNIHVAPGCYELLQTLRIERGMTIQGSGELELDADHCCPN